MKLPLDLLPLYSVAEAYALDCAAVESGIDSYLLMSRAALAAYQHLLKRFPEVEGGIAVICGSGNNAGDGYLLACLANQHELPVVVVQIGEITRLKGDAERAYQQAIAIGVPVVHCLSDVLSRVSVLVDALTGIGLRGIISDTYAAAITAMNQSQKPTLSLDIPSGLNADNGMVQGVAVVADLTVTFLGVKRGLLTGQAADYVGELVLETLDIPLDIVCSHQPLTRAINFSAVRHYLAPRSKSAHKGLFGHLIVLGGDLGMGGAAIMAAEAALRVGTGMVSVVTRPEHVVAALARRPELMVYGVEEDHDITALLLKASVLVVGPGLGQGRWSERLLRAALATQLPMVVDADGLNGLARLAQKTPLARDNWVLTPHPGEAGRLLSKTTTEIQQHRFYSVEQLQQSYGGVCVLKGSGSLIAGTHSLSVLMGGNPGMASAGMGDVLSGFIGGLLAQGLTPLAAAQLGAALHAKAADNVVEHLAEQSLLATDLLAAVGQILKK